tara:strand:+ start:214 stop:486 length:273 start_codon:yes stop_codon:yes gene_type:complete
MRSEEEYSFQVHEETSLNFYYQWLGVDSESLDPKREGDMPNLDMLQSLRNRHDEIRLLCEKHKVTQLAVFGSAATGKFHASSDLDFLVDF